MTPTPTAQTQDPIKISPIYKSDLYRSDYLKPETSNDLPNDVYKLPLKKHWCDHEDEIVISGISGRYPECENVNEFWDNLMSGEELVSIDDRRWPVGE